MDDNRTANSEETGPPVEDTGPLQLFSNKTNLSPDGFCMDTGQHWVYPVNYPERKYQLDIVRTALFQNTLVCLPTGLGKTFIAAVVMYNFYRWYPEKKVIFLAPTKPLVAQQIKACFDIIGIPHADTVEMTGTSGNAQNRNAIWQNKRMIFATPQVVANDLVAQVFPANSICCIVFDEAHKARGNYSYCQIINTLKSYNCTFRVLALSATPGADKPAIVDVFKNLTISKMKYLTDESPEVKKYTHNREVDVMKVSPNAPLKEASERLLNILSRNLAKLMQKGVVPKTSNLSNLSSFQLKTYYDRLITAPMPGVSALEINDMKQSCLIAMNISKAYELLVVYGKGAFLAHIAQTKAESANRFLVWTLNNDEDLKALIMDIETSTFDHPKLQKLNEVLITHFLEAEDRGEDTKVIIFSEYRNSVSEIKDYISQHDPLIRAVAFIGQSKKGGTGLNQQEQKQIMQDFKSNVYNTLISTCVGEEGLDIGEVDLIICYDANKSPVRLVQRMGRTGRKRDGRVVLLLTEGKEHQKYLSGLKQQSSVMKNISTWNLAPIINQITSPRMVPRGLIPELFRKILVIPKNEGIGELLKRAYKKGAASALIDNTSPFTTIDQIVSKWSGPTPDFKYLDTMEDQQLLSLAPRDLLKRQLEGDDVAQPSGFVPEDWSEWFSSAQCPPQAPQSTDSEDFIKLVQLADRITTNNTDQLTQTSDIASEAAYDILFWTDKLVPTGKKKSKSVSSSASSSKQPSAPKPKKKKPALPPPPLFKDDDVDDFDLAQIEPVEVIPEITRTKRSVADEIQLLVTNLSNLCKVAQVKTEVPIRKMLDSVSLLSSKFKAEEKPDFDFSPPDLSILDHIFGDMKIQGKQTVGVVSKSTEVVIKITPAKEEFTKKTRFTSTPIRKKLSNASPGSNFADLMRRKSSKSSTDSYFTAKTSFEDNKENIEEVHQLPEIISPVSKKSVEREATIPKVPPAFDFSLDIDLESENSLEVEHASPVIEKVPSPAQNVESSQETFVSDDLLCALAEKIEARDQQPKKSSEKELTQITEPTITSNVQVEDPARKEVPAPVLDDEEDFCLEDLDLLETKHCQQIEAEMSMKKEEPKKELAKIEEDKDSFDGDDWEDLDAKIIEAEQSVLKNSLIAPGQTQDDPIVLSSDDDDIGCRKPKKVILSSDDEEAQVKKEPDIDSPERKTDKVSKRIFDSQDYAEDDHPPAKKSKKKATKPGFFLTQASLSGDDSADDDFTQMDHYEFSFINEHSTQQETQAGVDMQAAYLQSIKSPPVRGKFKIPDLPGLKKRHICDTDPNKSLQDTYLEDSFCVPSEGSGSGDSSDDLLELMEKRLEKKRQEKRKTKSTSKNIPDDQSSKKKLRRVIAPVSSDSEEEQVVSKSSSVKSNFQVKEAKPKADWEDFKDVPSTSRTFAQPRASVQHNIKHQAVAKIDQPTSSKDKLSSGVAVKPDNPILMRPSTSAVVPPKLVQPMPAVERQSFLMPPVPPKVVAKPVAKLEPKKPELTNWQAPTSSKRSLQIDKFQDTANSSMLSFASEMPASSEDVIIIVSSKQIQQAPELVTSLNAKHNLKVLIKTLPNGIDFVLSERLAGIRIKIGDTSSYYPNSELAKSINTLKSYFPYGLIFFENDKKSCPVPDVNADFRPLRAPNWSNSLRKTLCFLTNTKNKFLFCKDQGETAENLAHMCIKESKTINRIEDLPNNSEGCLARFNFYSKLPNINIVKAMKLVAKFPVVADFIEVCSSADGVVNNLDVNLKTAGAIHKVINMPHN